MNESVWCNGKALETEHRFRVRTSLEPTEISHRQGNYSPLLGGIVRLECSLGKTLSLLAATLGWRARLTVHSTRQKRVTCVRNREGIWSPGSNRLYRVGLSQAQKAKEPGNVRPHIRAT